MKTVGIIAEYNPFHFGHLHQLKQSVSRTGEDTVVVAAMSGDYVQRGEAALFNKYARAEAACRCGADLVVELPFSWCCATAQTFARGGVSLLDGLGVTDLYFGAETEDEDLLESTAELLQLPQTEEEIRILQKTERTLSYAEARQIVIGRRSAHAAQLLRQPNCILGLEYLGAIRELDLEMKGHAVLRVGSAHDAPGGEGILSASEIRRRFRAGGSLQTLVPKEAFDVYLKEIEEGRVQRADDRLVLSRLLTIKKEELSSFADCGNGLGDALYKAVHSCRNLQQIEDAVSGKTFTRARVRRAICSAAAGNTETLGKTLPAAARLLACSEKGRGYLKKMRGATKIPVVTKPADVSLLDDGAQKAFAVSAAAHDLYTLGYEDVLKYHPGEDYMHGPVIA